ncbi:O-antigen/teichoic acid export membrane protein [Motilibacter peucedani]|uniref:O-antigen/teichoic acid export membrane protein n=1 Tax=Motilibacter peucedani TaxID=598650 RepID=A0A420XLF1_9ACTN|nr:oligosaccharide flippase family protein [Motilibacter peucedani]RKS71335.1 O-antigen/teichoic acid export membrane protein [Motilibacter peucedani]
MNDRSERTTLLTGVARSGSMAFVGTSGAAVLGFLLTLLVTRGLSTTTAGQFFSATAVFFVLQTLLAFGVGAGLVRFVPRLRALERTDDVPALLVVAVVPVVALGALGSVVLYVLSPLLARHLADGGSTSASTSAFRLLALFLLVGVLETGAVECTRAFGSISSYVLIQQISLPLLRPLLVLTAIALDAPLWAVVLGWLVPLALALALAARVVARCLHELFGSARAWPARHTPLDALAREYWSFTATRGLAGIIDILLTWLDVLIVSAIVSSSMAAVYASASRFVTTGTLVLSALRLAIAPQLSAALARGDRQRAGEMYSVASQWVVLSSWPLYLVMAAFSPTVLRIFGESYVSGATAMTVLCAAMMVNLAAGNVGTVLLMGGKSRWVLADKVVVLTINVSANLLLIPPFGITGAASAWALTIVVDSVISYCQVRWGMRVHGGDSGLRVAAALSLGVFGTAAVAVRLLLGSSLVTLVATVAVAGAVYAALVWRRRDELDLALLVAALRPGRGGGSADRGPIGQSGVGAPDGSVPSQTEPPASQALGQSPASSPAG